MLPAKTPEAKLLFRFQKNFAATRPPSTKINKLNRSAPPAKMAVNKTHTPMYENKPKKICGVDTSYKMPSFANYRLAKTIVKMRTQNVKSYILYLVS